MPNMKKYNKSIGTDVSGNDFKPFTETSGTSLTHMANVLGMCTTV